ncbi:ABC transporter substrate-binding protein [Verticiella sediminum]|uniref:ABC transporter substrate-binding protein n=1 Tax=Verticiella sediminum TaxID=1247510 RepID=A0A556AKG3_9BURK|nr:ABC transporter substrate-binding protein [Verticiella sediminum]TSH93387.1 ABC transporter substrate-binding protein [Verticiella sediminum]
MRHFRPAALAAALFLCASFAAHAQGVLRIGINEDPDTLDPTVNRLASGRQPMTAICDKLFDVSADDLSLVPQLATGYEVADDGMSFTLSLREGVKFHDGEPFDAEAVRFNFDRHMNTSGSFRRTELAAVDSVEVVDPQTVRVRLKSPQASIVLVNLAERAGMMVAPAAAQKLGERFGTAPVCAGEYRFVERVPQGRIVVERFADYWDPTPGGPDRVEYLPISDSTVRLSALRSGEIHIAERLTPTDLPQLEGDARVKVVSAPDLGYHHIRYNSNNGAMAKTFSDVRVRKAVDLAIDRQAIVKALFNDQYLAGNQFVSPQSQYYDQAHPVPARDVEASRRLLAEAGVPNLTFTLLVPAERERQEAAQFVQAMLAEAGITMRLETQENAVMLQNSRRGQFEAVFSFWSGRPHPDGNMFSHVSCQGPQNDSKYCNEELDAVLNKARETNDADERRKLYQQANGILAENVTASILWHRRTFTGVSSSLQGFVPHPDSTIRVKGMKMPPPTR